MKKSILIVLSLAFLPALAGAETIGEQSIADSSRVYDIDEVVVMEQPKEQFRLRQQPISSSSFASEQLQSIGVRDLRGLSSFVPSLWMPSYGTRTTAPIYVRGIGSRVNSPSVGIYVDGLPIQSKSAFNFHTYDVERVDVLHGPQGTLYGMNTEGGLIRMFTKNPFSYQGTDVKLSVGTKFWREAEINHYQKVSDKFAFSLAAFYDGQNGFFRNRFNDKHADLANEFGGRLRLLWRPTDRWDIGFLADYQYVRQNGYPYGRFITEEEKAAADITSPIYNYSARETMDPNTNYQSNYRRNILNTGLALNYKGNGFLFNSTTSWQMVKDYMLMDIDYLPQDFMHMEQRQLQNSLTQELSFRSNNLSKFHWTAGAFGSYQWLRTWAPVYFGPDMTSFLSKMISYQAYNGMLQAMAGRMIPGFIQQGMTEDAARQAALAAAAAAIERAGGCNINVALGTVPGLFHTPTLNAGVYYEMSYDILPRLSATAGLRYDYSNVRIEYATNGTASMDANVMGQQMAATVTSALNHKEHDHFNQLLPKFALSYKIDNHNSNIYATVAKGYRAGGYNIEMFSDILQTELQGSLMTTRSDIAVEHDANTYSNIANTISYKPETSWNYELGTHLNLLNNQLHIDLATFYMSIRDQQLSVMAGNYGFGRMMVNAGKSHSTGLELTARGSFIANHLNWALAYGFTSAKFDEYKDSINGKEVNYENRHVPFVPQHTIGASVDYRMDIDRTQLLYTPKDFTLHSITFGLNLQSQGQIWWNEENTAKQRFYAVMGAHALFDLGRLSVNVWARNLTDTKYNTFAVESAATGTKYTFAQLGNPFQAGIDINLHF